MLAPGPRRSCPSLESSRVSAAVPSCHPPSFSSSCLPDVAAVYDRRPALAALRRSGAIADAHAITAEFWATDYMIGFMGRNDPFMERDPHGRATHDGPTRSRLGAIERYKYIRAAIGGRCEKLLILLMVEGRSMPAIASHFGTEQTHVAGALALLLDMLMDHYDEMPGPLWKG